jgi:hypothetical protein
MYEPHKSADAHSGAGFCSVLACRVISACPKLVSCRKKLSYDSKDFGKTHSKQHIQSQENLL